MRLSRFLLLCLCALALLAPAAGARSIESEIVACANHQRVEHGLKKLRVSSALSKAGRLHARNMLSRGFFDHVDPRGRSPQDRVNIFEPGRWGVGENIAAGYPTVAVACDGWMHSAGHRANILNPGYTHIGAGYAEGGRN